MSVQVCIPVQIPGQAVTSVSLLSLHKSDMRLLETAAKLGPLIAEAAQAVAEALAEEAQEEEEDRPSSNGELSECCCSFGNYCTVGAAQQGLLWVNMRLLLL